MLKKILIAISEGNTSIDQISKELGMQKSALLAAIKQLVKLGFLEPLEIPCPDSCPYKCYSICFKIKSYPHLSAKGKKFLEQG